MGGVFECNEKHEIKINATKDLYYCEIVPTDSTGNLTALLIGNSFSMNVLAAVAANPLFSRVISIWGNSISFPVQDEVETYLMEEVIKKLQHDVTFIVQRYYQTELLDTPIEDIEANKEFQHWNQMFKILQNYTSGIIMNQEQISFAIDVSYDYIRRKFYGLPIESRMRISVGLI